MSNIEDDVRILFNLKCYLESLLASGQDKIFYNDLLYDEKTIDCINAIEDLLKERKKYTIRLTDEEYGRVIDIAQKDIAEQKDKRIKELEIKLKCAKGLYDDCCKCLVDSIPKQVVIDAINKHKLAYEELGIKYTNTHYEDDEKRARDFYMIVTEDRIIQVLQELLGEEKNRNV